MAELKLYRVVFTVGDDKRVQFSKWCVVADKDHVLAELEQDFGVIGSADYELLAWEEKELDTDPF